MNEKPADPLSELRKEFPASVIGKLPKGGVLLDYVGHAAVTDRLLTVDPKWNWEPLSVDARGLPVLDDEGNLWIKLTVCGITRLGVGDGKTMKERIGDAIRNAAMRFGVALSLWSKDELESTAPEPDPPATAEQIRQILDWAERLGWSDQNLSKAVVYASRGRTTVLDDLTGPEAETLLRFAESKDTAAQ